MEWWGGEGDGVRRAQVLLELIPEVVAALTYCLHLWGTDTAAFEARLRPVSALLAADSRERSRVAVLIDRDFETRETGNEVFCPEHMRDEVPTASTGCC